MWYEKNINVSSTYDSGEIEKKYRRLAILNKTREYGRAVNVFKTA